MPFNDQPLIRCLTHIHFGTSSKLPVEHQIETYATFLRDIARRDEVHLRPCADFPCHIMMLTLNPIQRERCLDLADRAGLNVNAITKRVVELSLAVTTPPAVGSTADTITLEHEAGIRSIEWLTFDPEQRIDALVHANALARRLIGTPDH